MDSSYLAFRYLKRAKERVEVVSLATNGNRSTRAPGTAAAPGPLQAPSSGCKECDADKSNPQKVSRTRPTLSGELLKFVLESAREGTLKNMSGIVKQMSKVGEGGFADVFRCTIEGKDIAVKRLRLGRESKGFVVKVRFYCNIYCARC